MRACNIPDAASDYFDVIFVAATEFTDCNAAKLKGLGVNGIMLPPVIFDSEREEVVRLLEAARKMGVKYALVGNLGHLSLVRQMGFLPIGGFRLNVSNTETATLLTETVGVESVMLSPELSLPRVRTISKNARASVIVYGRVPLMIVEKCVISELYPCGYARNGGAPCKACSTDSAKLVDRTGTAFPVMREFSHRNVIFNSLPTYMADKQRDLFPESECARHFIFTTETADEVAEVIRAYENSSPAERPVRRIGV
jgi:putative protease